MKKENIAQAINSRSIDDADYWIEKLQLQAHPEGGYFRETFAGADILKIEGLPSRYTGPRKTYTLIYYLLKSGQVSNLHRLKSDEIFTFYAGSPLILHQIDESGHYRQEKLGLDYSEDISFQRLIKAGVWFGATVSEKDSFSLVGCFVAPGFEFDDFEMGNRASLLALYPRHAKVIEELTLS
jgi:uncharacterized protein